MRLALFALKGHMPYTNVPQHLWGKMDDCKSKVMAKGHSEESAIAICHASIVGGFTADTNLLNFILDTDEFTSMNKPDYVHLEEYVSLTPGDPIRLFPFGKIVKNGREHVIDAITAAKFKIPHFDPPVKLGKHDDDAPAGGFIKRLEVRDDGLYAHIELTDKGARALADGDYRYHSPEVVWEGGFEDPATGEIIDGPFIVGDALLHTPHLGRQAALFTSEVKPNKEKVMEETVQVPTSLWDKFMAFIDRGIEPGNDNDHQEPEIPEEYKAAAAERDDYKAKFEALQTERQREELMATVKGEFATDEFGAAFKALPETEGLLDILAGLPEEQRAVVVEQFKALSAQIKESDLMGEVGAGGAGEEDPRKALDAAIKAYAAEHKVDYNTALSRLAQEQPELF